jgi:hypothetical protein
MKYGVFIFLIISVNLGAQNLSVSGLLDTTLTMKAGAGDTPAFSYGFEEYANIRMQAKVRDAAVFNGAFNIIAASGDSALAYSSNALDENYIANIELERLYCKLYGEAVNLTNLDLEVGLLRLPFGYSQIWGSTDFLNPKNPLKPDARPRAVLGGGLSWYVTDDLKLLGFGAASRDPVISECEGLGGLSLEQHWEKLSVQLLYAYEAVSEGIHRAGVSCKADVEAGLILDALYTYNREADTKLEGLSLSLGADYSFFDGNLIILAEYLYNGASSSTAYSNEHYLYTGFTWRFNDYTNVTAALISGFDDLSFTPLVSLNHDLFQGAALTVSAQVPLDRDLFAGDGNRGELGPLPPDYLQPLPQHFGRYFDLSVKLRLRF